MLAEADLILAPVVVVAILAAFGLGWVAGARYVLRLRRALNVCVRELTQTRAALREAGDLPMAVVRMVTDERGRAR